MSGEKNIENPLNLFIPGKKTLNLIKYMFPKSPVPAVKES